MRKNMKSMNIGWFALTALAGAVACSFAAASGNTPTASPPNLTAAELYEQYLNLPLPSEVKDLKVENRYSEYDFLKAAYFQYTAAASYFTLLQSHDKFKESSEFNEKIHPVRCSTLPQDFSYWTTAPLDLANKVCYRGVYFPYVHYLIYDPATQHVDHFVEGMRD
jgi:hypothetical protein